MHLLVAGKHLHTCHTQQCQPWAWMERWQSLTPRKVHFSAAKEPLGATRRAPHKWPNSQGPGQTHFASKSIGKLRDPGHRSSDEHIKDLSRQCSWFCAQVAAETDANQPTLRKKGNWHSSPMSCRLLRSSGANTSLQTKRYCWVQEREVDLEKRNRS